MTINTLKKSDFVLLPYMQKDDLRATLQVLNTLGPYILLWFLAVEVAKVPTTSSHHSASAVFFAMLLFDA